jgi:hypothetical protein
LVTLSSAVADRPLVGGISVLLWAATPIAEELDEAMFSLLHQDTPPLELVFCHGRPETQLPAAQWAEEAAAAGIGFVRVQVPEASCEAELLNAGLGRVSGRFLAFLGSNAVAFPAHLQRLRAALVATEQVCALATAQQALLAPGAGFYVQSKRPHIGWYARGVPRFDAMLPSRLMLDRDRAVPFDLRFRDRGEAWRDGIFPALFEAFAAVDVDGAPSVELRVNAAAESTEPRPQRWIRRRSVGLKDWQRSVLPRHRVVDAVNSALKAMFPSIHRRLRRRIGRWRRDP